MEVISVGVDAPSPLCGAGFDQAPCLLEGHMASCRLPHLRETHLLSHPFGLPVSAVALGFDCRGEQVRFPDPGRMNAGCL